MGGGGGLREQLAQWQTTLIEKKFNLTSNEIYSKSVKCSVFIYGQGFTV